MTFSTLTRMKSKIEPREKKVRSSNGGFVEPNTFQQIATKKTNFEKATMDQSNSINQSFRI